MTQPATIRLAALAGFSGVALGAFGAHGLKDILTRNGTADVWETAVLYHLVHAMALLFLAGRSPVRTWPCVWFCLGVLIFSGSLYLLALTNARWLGAITPLGGFCFLVGWGWLIFSPALSGGSAPEIR